MNGQLLLCVSVSPQSTKFWQASTEPPKRCFHSAHISFFIHACRHFCVQGRMNNVGQNVSMTIFSSTFWLQSTCTIDHLIWSVTLSNLSAMSPNTGEWKEWKADREAQEAAAAASSSNPSGQNLSQDDATEAGFEFQSTAGSEFSLVGELKRARSDAGDIEEARSSKQAKAGKLDKDDGLGCHICAEPRAKGSSKCWVHKRALDCIQKQSARVPADQKCFIQIFGEPRKGPPNQALADKVLLDFCAMYPEGKIVKGGHPCDNLSAASHTHTLSCQKSSAFSEYLDV